MFFIGNEFISNLMGASRKNWKIAVGKAFKHEHYIAEEKPIQIYNSNIELVRNGITMFIDRATWLAEDKKLNKNFILRQTSTELCADPNSELDADRHIYDHQNIIDSYKRYLNAGGNLVIIIKFELQKSRLLTMLSDPNSTFKKQIAIYQFDLNNNKDKKVIIPNWKGDSLVFDDMIRFELNTEGAKSTKEQIKAGDYKAYLSPNDKELANKLVNQFDSLMNLQPKRVHGEYVYNPTKTKTLEHV